MPTSPHRRWLVPALLFLVVVLLTMQSDSVDVAADSRDQTTVPRLKYPVVIDGKWSAKDEWNDAVELPLNSSGGKTLGYLRIKYDNSSLYFLADIFSKSNLQGSGCDQNAPVVDTAWTP